MIEDGRIIITSKDEHTGVVTIEYSDANNRVIKTVWHRTLHDAGAYGTDLLREMTGDSRSFSFPKSLYAEKDALSSILRKRKDALILDFFAGSGTTLNAINLLNKEDGGKRRCILVTNNEISEEQAIRLLESGNKHGDTEWEAQGICQSVTWPRTKASITGKRPDGKGIKGDYYTSLSKDRSISRRYTQIDYITLDQINSVARRKKLISLLGKGIIPQSLVTGLHPFITPEDDKYSGSILFDPAAKDEWLESLEDKEYLRDFFIVTSNSSLFRSLKSHITELLGDYTVQEQVRFPMSDGFKSNAVFFQLGFLDKTDVALGTQFKELLPVLWMKAECVGPCPILNNEDIPNMLIFPKNKFAVLADEVYFSSFEQQLKLHPEIQTLFIITDSEPGYREMISHLHVKNTYHLYRDYLDNFRINTGR